MVRVHTNNRERILFVAAKSFLEKGYTNTTLRQIASKLGGTIGIITSHFDSKEDILAELVKFVVESQFDTTEKLLAGKTEDKLLFYAAETVLQLHITEMSENLRDLYSSAYSLPKTSAILQETITGKLQDIFGAHLPHLETKDFYKLEIATGGIMRGFMTVPCNMWFTMDQKVESFLECVFRLFMVPEEKIREAIAFVGQFDFARIAQETIAGIITFLEQKKKEIL